ncbi:MAG: hypothetical protein ABIH23_03225 [bacterium]
MHKMLIVLMVLAMVAGMSFALEVGGSTAVAGVGNADEQRLEVDQEIDIDIGVLHLDVNGGFDYTFHDKAKFWNYDIGGKYTLGILTVGASFTGNQDLKFNEIKAFGDIVAGPVGADVDALFSADPEKDFFRGAEFSGFWKPGPVELRIGYMMVPDGGKNLDKNTPEALTGGGLYAKAKLSY